MNGSSGLHHITAIAGNPRQNLDFYRGVLGLRLVKKTVNYDDPSAYHLFYGDQVGSPGSIISFFAYPSMQEGEPGVGQAIAVSFSIPAASIDFWMDYLTGKGIDFVEPFERFGKLVIGFQDLDGLYLELVGDPGNTTPQTETSGNIPSQHAIRGLHGITLAEENHQSTGQLLQESFGYDETATEHDRVLHQSDTELGNNVEVIDGSELDGEQGRGTVHHIAFRADSEDSQQSLRTNLKEIGYHLTEIEDRHYFKSFFFHEPGGVMIEVATETPGFSADENPDQLGTNLCLPPELEGKRSLIEAELPVLNER